MIDWILASLDRLCRLMCGSALRFRPALEKIQGSAPIAA